MFDDTKKSAHLVAPELLPAFDMIPPLNLSDEGLKAARAMMSSRPEIDISSLPEPLRSVRCEEHNIPNLFGAPDVRVLVYQPPGESSNKPALLHMHGGGYVLGFPEINDLSNRSAALELGCCVVSVAYRLAPETRFPGSVEDCYSALAWVHQNAEQLGIDSTRVAVTGESAGAGHSAALSIMARDRNEYPICFLLLDSPMLDDKTGSVAETHPYCGEYTWTPGNNYVAWKSLLGVEPGSDDVPENAVPARVADLTGLPPTFIVIGALDLFLEESLEYSRRLSRAGVPVELHVVPGAFHAYGAAGPQAPQVAATLQWKNSAFKMAWKI